MSDATSTLGSIVQTAEGIFDKGLEYYYKITGRTLAGDTIKADSAVPTPSTVIAPDNAPTFFDKYKTPIYIGLAVVGVIFIFSIAKRK